MNGQAVKRTLVVVSIVMLAAICGFTAGYTFRPGSTGSHPEMISPIVADDSMRGLAGSLDAADVRALRFRGFEIGKQDSEITVTDPKLIGRFLEGLRGATSASGANDFIIDLRRSIPNLASSLEFDFSPRNPHTSFGDKFHSVLKELRMYQARRFRNLLAKVENRIRRIEVGDHVIKDPVEIRSVATALKHLDERAFAFTEPKCYMFTLFVNSGRDPSIFVMMYVKEPPDAHLPVEDRPLPPPLWECYVKVVGADLTKWRRLQGVQNPL